MSEQHNAIVPNVTKARHFAQLMHASQCYGPEVPYVVHLEQVGDVLYSFGFMDETWRSCGFLHDILEDTNCSYNDIASRFGTVVAERVYAVTNELGRNRKERNDKTYPKLAQCRDGIILKLADRIANVSYGLQNGGKSGVYADEFPGFAKALYHKDHTEAARMWQYLARLLNKTDALAALT